MHPTEQETDPALDAADADPSVAGFLLACLAERRVGSGDDTVTSSGTGGETVATPVSAEFAEDSSASISFCFAALLTDLMVDAIGAVMGELDTASDCEGDGFEGCSSARSFSTALDVLVRLRGRSSGSAVAVAVAVEAEDVAAALQGWT